MPNTNSDPIVAVVAYDRISAFHLAVPGLVFSETARVGERGYEVRVCSIESGALTTTAGYALSTAHGIAALADAAIIVVPSWRDVAERPPEALLAALRAASARGAQIVGLCLGAYVLAAAGLLDGRRATTHWAYARDFAARFPAVRVDADVLYVEDGAYVTSAGTAAGIDCCLYLVRQRHGAQVANRVARRLVTPPHRQGGQAQYIEQVLPESARGSQLAALTDWVRAHPTLPHTLDSLAQRAAMSRRTLTRRFRELTGMSVGDWLLGERLALAQRLLEGSERPIDTVAEGCGLGSAASLRAHFKRQFGVSPSDWRRTFHS